MTAAYDDGPLQRYLVDSEIHGCITGKVVAVEGYGHVYSVPTCGYVLRGAGCDTLGAKLYAEDDGALRQTGWVVTNAYDGGPLQRYWIRGGAVVSGELISEEEAGWFAYATPCGYVVRGKYARILDDGTSVVYLADQDGKLIDIGSSDAFVVTNAYDAELQRYWIIASVHAARTGFSKIAGYGACYSDSQLGYVVRGSLGTMYVADNDGKLATIANGWVVTDGFGQGLQRYWFRDGVPVTSELISELQAGWLAYATPEGYVVRGKYVSNDGNTVYLADNDGRLEDPGWHVTAAYDYGELERYFVNLSHKVAIGMFVVDGEDYYGINGSGYVLRGSANIDNMLMHADNDGRLYLSFGTETVTGDTSIKSVTTSTFVGNVSYLFLPSYANLTNIKLTFESLLDQTMLYISTASEGGYVPFQSGNAIDLSLADYATDSNGAYLVYYRQRLESSSKTLAIMLSKNVKAVFIISVDPDNFGRTYVEGDVGHNAVANACILVVDPDGTVVYGKDNVSSGKTSEIKGRGNSTWAAAKKPYQIKLNKKCDLLETGSDSEVNKTWLLLANAADATLLHDTLAYNLALELGMSGATDCAPADLYYDGDYRGSYLLCEKVEIKNGRVNINDLEKQIDLANEGVDVDSLPTAQATNAYGYTYQYVSG